MEPLISVIMGVYNIGDKDLLTKSVNSILNQTYKNFEFLICDDGSTDNTYQWIKELSNEDRRIIVLRNQKNEGLAFTLNKCIDVSKGELIARQDADDISAIERFEKQVKFLTENTEYSFVGSNCALFDENGIWGRRFFPYKPEAKDFLFKMPYQHGALMFRKDCLIKMKGYTVSKETRRAEDYELLMRLHASHIYGANIQEDLYFFLENKDAMQRRKYRYRIDEAKVRYKGFKLLGLMPIAIPYIIKPLIVGLIPRKLLKRLKLLYYRNSLY